MVDEAWNDIEHWEAAGLWLECQLDLAYDQAQTHAMATLKAILSLLERPWGGRFHNPLDFELPMTAVAKAMCETGQLNRRFVPPYVAATCVHGLLYARILGLIGPGMNNAPSFRLRLPTDLAAAVIQCQREAVAVTAAVDAALA